MDNSPKITLSSETSFSIQEVADAIKYSLTHDEIFQLIDTLEDNVCDLDFTKKLYLHFKNVYEQGLG